MSHTEELSYVIHEATRVPWIGAPFESVFRSYDRFDSRIGGIPMFPPHWYSMDDEQLKHHIPFMNESKPNCKTDKSSKHDDSHHDAGTSNSTSTTHTSKSSKAPAKILDVHPHCRICEKPMTFIAQLFAPLDNWDRFIFVWACCDEDCGRRVQHMAPSAHMKRFRAYRLQTEYDGDDDQDDANDQNEHEETEPQPELTQAERKEQFEKEKDAWTLDNQEDSALDDELSNLLAASKKTTATASQESTPAPKPVRKKKPKVKAPKHALPCYELDIFEEPTEDDWIHDNPDSQAASIMKNYKEKGGELPNQTEFSDDSKEKYEDGAMSLGMDGANNAKIDKQFLKFQIALEKCPDQSVRWQWKGKPLWASTKYLPSAFENNLKKYAGAKEKSEILSMSIPPCPVCKNPRTFEFQIIPTIIYQLFKKNTDAMDFGSVFIFTCSSSCCAKNKENASLQECYVHVQPPIE